MIYQLATLYITIVSQGVSAEIKVSEHFAEWLAKTPVEQLESWSQQVPEVSGYFFSYVLGRIGMSLPMLLSFPILSCGGPVYPDYASESVSVGLIFIIGLTYSITSPLIMPLCLLYFCMAYVVYCWLFRYAYTPEFDGGGAYFRELYYGCVIGLVFGTLSLAALVGSTLGWATYEF
eukprot:CAMPEP_0198593030 /NCGR_PEP_ID=MMETSP1462-20131121/138886_1 /TAXON_ID=1333877 /ORGANISM="Brandtodinium nutriculum, Strain RCC3387" /LENGTH=175 /DNA_ID=CAMNT_0044324627 /DNA_START=306 /DNA_END=830 /DNA_ORIENTATION=+